MICFGLSCKSWSDVTQRITKGILSNITALNEILLGFCRWSEDHSLEDLEERHDPMEVAR